MTNEELSKVVPDFPSTWRAEDYIHHFIPFRHVLVIGALIWPEFCVVDGLVIMQSSFESYPSWRDKAPSNPMGVEAVLNHHHILDLFKDDGLTHDQVLAFGRLLKKTWMAKLSVDFPDRIFTVDFPESFDLRVDNPSISFWQVREKPIKDPDKADD